MAEPLDPDTLADPYADLRAEHRRSRSINRCWSCENVWPCPTAVLLAERDALVLSAEAGDTDG